MKIQSILNNNQKSRPKILAAQAFNHRNPLSTPIQRVMLSKNPKNNKHSSFSVTKQMLDSSNSNHPNFHWKLQIYVNSDTVKTWIEFQGLRNTRSNTKLCIASHLLSSNHTWDITGSNSWNRIIKQTRHLRPGSIQTGVSTVPARGQEFESQTSNSVWI